MVRLFITFFIVGFLLTGYNLFAQINTVDSATYHKVLKTAEKKFPKFYREFNYLKNHDTLIQNIFFANNSCQFAGLQAFHIAQNNS